ncbi:MAG: RNA polymerase subunit RPABC4/transcription elongation factor Spt4 [Vicingaceae bacterium]|jgi:RNA polymerase subunit RPABC4/transcription elongation factor Spt4
MTFFIYIFDANNMNNSITQSKLTSQKRECQNCNFNYNGDLCPNCGQRFLEGRFIFKDPISWVFEKLLNVEKGLFFAIKVLTVNTCEMLSKYFKKANVPYIHPFRLAFFMATMSATLTVFSGTFDSILIMQFSEGMTEGWNCYQI